jgi:hypothetical protein
MHAAVAESVSGDRIPSGMNHPSGVDEIVRLSDSAVWSSDEMAQFLEDQGIKLINYSQIRKIQHCCVSWHSGSEALQLQRPECAGHFRATPPSRMRLPIRSEWKLSTLDGPTTIESKRQSARPGIEISFPS